MSSGLSVPASAVLLAFVAVGCSAAPAPDAPSLSAALLPGCTIDSDCSADTYCDVTQLLCVPTRAAGEPLPLDALHDGSCNLQNAALLCRSGACNPVKNTCATANGAACSSAAMCTSDVCGANNLCGIEEGGTCESTSAKQCQTNRCSGVNDNGQGRCVRAGGCATDAECNKGSYCDPAAFSCKAKLAAGIALPSDSLHDGTCSETLAARTCETGSCSVRTNTCAAPNGGGCTRAEECESGACGDNGRCGLAIGQAGCTSETQAALCQSGNCAASGVCVPPLGCNVDAECAPWTFCNRVDHLCVSQLRVGASLPKDGLHDGMCSDGLAQVACSSGRCNDAANSCAAATNSACTDAWQCVTNVCADNGKCGEKNGLGACTRDAQCQSGRCQVDTMRCVASEHGCTHDADCPHEQYCNLTQLRCVDDLADGTLLPPDSIAAGKCTSESARSVCASGACNPANGTCAKRAGSACSAASECAADVCSDGVCGRPDGSAGACTQDTAAEVCQSGICQLERSRCIAAKNGCAADSDCSKGKYCDRSSLACAAALSMGAQLPRGEACSAELAAFVCESGACNSRSNTCANVVGAHCSSARDCASDACFEGACLPADLNASYRLAGGGCSSAHVPRRTAGSIATLCLLALALSRALGPRRRRQRQAQSAGM